MTFDHVDRSDFTPNFDGRMGDEVFDIGWAQGVLQDGRPYRMECWGYAGSTGVTVSMASDGLDGADAAQVHTLLEASGVITTLKPQQMSVLHFVDAAGTPCLAISYIVADEDDEYYVEAHPLLTSYRPGNGERVTFAEETDEELMAALDAWPTNEKPKRSPQAEARRAAKALAKLQPKKKRKKRRKFGKGKAATDDADKTD